MNRLRGQVAVVTGAAQGLGYAIAKAYIAEGMKVALMDIRGDILGRVAAEFADMGGDALPITVDLSDAVDTQAAIDTALARYGTPRVLIHNAALLITRSMLEITLPQWQKEINIILQAAFILSKAVWKPMIEAGGGSIVYLSSGSGYKGFIEEVAYNPGKHGIEGLMKCLALDGANHSTSPSTRPVPARRSTRPCPLPITLRRRKRPGSIRLGWRPPSSCWRSKTAPD